MKKIDYTITALTPIFTGSDENFGTERKFRREKRLLLNPINYNSRYSDESRRLVIVEILYHIYQHLDFASMQKSRLMGIYDEFASKVLASASVPTKEKFLTKVCEKLGIRTIQNTAIIHLFNSLSDVEFLDTIRDEIQYLIILLRDKKNKKGDDLFSVPFHDNITLKKYYDEVPVIAGNSVRGKLRRLLMRDFIQRAEIKKMDKRQYHMLFTGGTLNASTNYEDIDAREKLISLCPAIGLLGSAIGNMTIEGDLKVGGARPKCLENNSGELSYWELMDVQFGTRLDSSKVETEIEIIGEPETNQMKYEYEVIIAGTVFDSFIVLTNDNSLIESCFWKMIELWKSDGFICGNSARDSGKVSIDIEIPEGATKEYEDYIKNNKEEIKKYFGSIV